MISSSDKPRRRPRPLHQQVITLFSAAAFLSFSGTALFNLYSTALNQGKQESVPVESQENLALEQLRLQERGYELVWEREPENKTASEGLVQTRIQMNNPAGAIEPLEKIVELEPDRREIANLLDEIRTSNNAANNQ
jgi:predicted Zn-dependent protease